VCSRRAPEICEHRVASPPQRDTCGRIHVRYRLQAICKQVTDPVVAAECHFSWPVGRPITLAGFRRPSTHYGRVNGTENRATMAARAI
jgi:hypothetical protein